MIKPIHREDKMTQIQAEIERLQANLDWLLEQGQIEMADRLQTIITNLKSRG